MFITHEQYKPKNIRYGFFTKEVTTSKALTAEELKLLGDEFGSDSVAIVTQKHTDKVILVKDYDDHQIADGQVTNKSNIALGVLTADCVPILFADEIAGVVATVHAGWRGAKTDIMARAVEKMRALGANNITAIIGPCIKQRSYEVDKMLYEDFIQESATCRKFFIPASESDRYMFDLPGYVKSKLAALNIKQILDIDRNTYEEEENFFSFRRTTHNPESPMGNLVSVIMLLS